MIPKQPHPKSETWWGAVWRGLVVDGEAKHLSKLGPAVWLYLYLIIHADRRTGRLVRRSLTIAQDMHVPLRTIRRWLAILRDEEYASVLLTGRSLIIHIHRWKPWIKDEYRAKAGR